MLAVVRGHALDRVSEQSAVEGVAPGVELIDLALRRRGVALLDYPQERAVRITDDPAEAGKVTSRGQHGHGVGGRHVAAGKIVQRFAAQQRHVAVGDHYRARHRADGLSDHPDCVAGAELLLLDDDGRLRGRRGDRSAHLLLHVPHHDHEPLRVKFRRRCDRVPEQRAPGKRVQHLRGTGLHALALAGGEDHDCGRGSFAHE